MKRYFLLLLAAAILGGGYLAVRPFSNPITLEGAAFQSTKTGQSKMIVRHGIPRGPASGNRISDELVPSVTIEATLLELVFLPEQKRAIVARIVREAELEEQEIVNSTQGFRTSADEQRIQALKASRDQRIRVLLSENEWQAYEERTSSVGLELMGRLNGLPFSPEQFSYLFQSMQALEKWIAQQDADGVGGARAAAQEEMEKLVEQLLGTEGRKAFERNSDPSFAHLERFAQRYQLPNSTTGAIYDQLKVIEALDAQPLDLDRFPDGIDSAREATHAHAEAQLAALIPDDAFSEFASVWLGR